MAPLSAVKAAEDASYDHCSASSSRAASDGVIFCKGQLPICTTTLRCEIVPLIVVRSDSLAWSDSRLAPVQRERPTWESCMPRRTEAGEGGRALNVRREIIRVNSRTDNPESLFCKEFFCLARGPLSHTGVSLPVSTYHIQISFQKTFQTLICKIEICHACC